MDQFEKIMVSEISKRIEPKSPLEQFMCERIAQRLVVKKTHIGHLDIVFDQDCNGPFIPPVYSRMKTEHRMNRIEHSDKELIFDKLTLDPEQTRGWRRSSTEHQFNFCIIRNKHTAFLVRIGTYEYMEPYAEYPDCQFYFKIVHSPRLNALLDYKFPCTN